MGSRITLTTATAGGYASASVTSGEYYMLNSGMGAGVASGSGYIKISGTMNTEYGCALLQATSDTIRVTGGSGRGTTNYLHHVTI